MALHLRRRQPTDKRLLLQEGSSGLRPERESHGRLEGRVRDDAPHYMSIGGVSLPRRNGLGGG